MPGPVLLGVLLVAVFGLADASDDYYCTTKFIGIPLGRQDTLPRMELQEGNNLKNWNVTVPLDLSKCLPLGFEVTVCDYGAPPLPKVRFGITQEVYVTRNGDLWPQVTLDAKFYCLGFKTHKHNKKNQDTPPSHRRNH